jgi:hypothetical protein
MRFLSSSMSASISLSLLLLLLTVTLSLRASHADSSSSWYTTSTIFHYDNDQYHHEDTTMSTRDPKSGTAMDDYRPMLAWMMMHMRAHEHNHQHEEEEEEDNDDDDDDGHSSMLSNAMLPRRTARYHEDDDIATTWRMTVARASPIRTSSSNMRRRVSRASRRRATHSWMTLRGGASVATSSASTSSTSTTTRNSHHVWEHLLVTALVTLVYEGCLGHFLEFAKIVMQTSPPGTTYAQVWCTITASKGLVGIWDGFVPWGVIQSIGKGAVFGLAHAMASSLFVSWAQQGLLSHALAATLAGGLGGGIQGYILSPTLLLKTRVMTNNVFRERMSVFKTSWLSLAIGMDVVRQEGIMALMKGSNMFALKRVFDWASRYYFADVCEALWVTSQHGKPLTLGQKSIASLLGGVASTCVTLPLDVLVAKIQDAKQAGVSKSPLRMVWEEWNEKGWSGMQRAYCQGFIARLLHVCLTTVGTYSIVLGAD